ncbi:MAG: DNA primase [Candidatus Micrarchaeota archaeon]|nr:DNA primase [Candidatus Micrarchaeota archaeon]
MGKTYIDTVKYLVYANVEIGGLVEKPDVVGAVFGQTEGLLGDDLDLRELQKNGRIGRIEVDLTPRGGKAVGKIKLPSSLDMVETCILAAALETVDRVGPCDAHLSIDKIEDTRNVKRKGLVDRAKFLLKNMLVSEIPESKEISEQVRAEVKTAEISEYGPEKLPCGPGIDKMDAIILCEGRADVINLLKNDITNVVGVGGANVAQSVAKLCQEKEVTVFLDGDRGGDIILAELARIADIDFVARAPSGKEVEELTRKELIKCLRSKVPYEQGSTGPGQEDRQQGRYRPQRGGYERKEVYAQQAAAAPFNAPAPAFDSGSSGYTGRPQRGRGSDQPPWAADVPRGRHGRAVVEAPMSPPPMAPQFERPAPRFERATPERAPPLERPAPAERAPAFERAAPAPTPEPEPAPAAPSLTSVPPELNKSLEELENTLRARFYDASLACTKEIPVRDMIKSLEEEPSVYAVVFDGIITQRLADLAESKKAQVLLGIKLGNVFRKPAGVLLHTKQ